MQRHAIGATRFSSRGGHWVYCSSAEGIPRAKVSRSDVQFRSNAAMRSVRRQFPDRTQMTCGGAPFRIAIARKSWSLEIFAVPCILANSQLV